MAETTKMENVHLRNIPDLIDAHEMLYNKQARGEIDGKTADAMNTTLKGSTYLLAKLPLEVMKANLAAQVKKQSIPPMLMPKFTREGSAA